jgi:hypothetical protein
MTANLSSLEWLSRFCARLMPLRHDLDMHAAARRGVDVFSYASELPPEDAADIYHLAYMRTRDSAPGDQAGLARHLAFEAGTKSTA